MIIDLSRQHKGAGSKGYQIDSMFKPTDIIVPNMVYDNPSMDQDMNNDSKTPN